MRILLLVISLYICGVAKATNYYFSSSIGDDTRTSTQAQNPATPWKTISKLNSFFSSLVAGDSVLFMRNETFYGSITINKSGNSGNYIKISAYGTGANPIITGLTTISGWVNIGGNLWESSSAVSTLSTCMMVVINGTSYPMGRYPNVSSTIVYPGHPVPGNNGWLNYESYSGATQITDNELPSTPNWTGAKVVVKKANWQMDVGRITNHSGNTITYTPTLVEGGFQDGIAGMSYYIEDDIRTLDEQNEWYYNPSTKKLTIYSTSTPTNVQVATVQTVINGNNKSYINLNNIDIQGSNDDMIVLSNNTTGWTYLNCNLSFSGRDALYGQAITNVTIQNCNISNANNNGIMLKDGNDGITINDNAVTNVGIYAGMTDQSRNFSCEGIHCLGDNTTIQGNKVSNIGNDGIRFEGSNVLIKRNFVTNYCMVKTDAGGIYTWGVNGSVTHTNQIIEENIIVNGSDLGVIGTWLELEELSVNGIYLDGESKNVIVRNNNISHVNASGIYMNTPINCTVRDNTVYDCRYASIHANNNNGSILNLKVRNNICAARSLNTSPTGSNQRCFYYLSINNDITSCLSPDSNYYARPMDDNTANPISRVVYNGSYTGPGEPGVQTRYTLSAWKTAFPAFDQNSKKSPLAITNINDLRFEYNETALPKTITLGATYIDMRSVSYPGTITLQPFTSAVLIKTTAGNISPTANAGVDQNIILPTNSVSLNGSGTDPDGTITAYLWTKVSGPASGSITNPTSATTSVTALAQGVYKFELKVTDNSGATDTDTMQVTVNAALNQLPTANAGLDQNITLPTNTVSLNGSGTDPDGTITAYLWTKISGPASGSITNATSATTSVTALAQGVYKFELKVTDNSGATDTDTMQVTVNAAPNQLPTANAGLDQNITLPTNTVSLNGSGTDPDGTITAYLWTKISGPASGSITNATSATTNATALVVGVYKFELKVTDNSGAIDTDTMQVTVNAALNQLPTANAGLDQNITLPTNTVSLNGSGTDPDGTITAYLWTKVSGPASGSITNATSATTNATALVVGVYKFELKVTDNSGATDTDTMQVTVNPAPNQAPTANAGLDQNITLPTNSVSLNGSGTDPDGTITAYLWTKVSGPASGSITNATSATTNATALVVGVYKFELKVTDNSGATDTDTMQVNVNPAPNQAPTANAGLDQNIILPTNSVSLNGSGTDPDGTITAYLWTKVSGPASGSITNPTSATTSVTALVQGVYKFELKVTDNSGATDTDTMQVTVNAAPNQAPTANAGLDQNITLPTNSVSLNGSGTDPDGTITAYLWTKVSGPASGSITNPTSATTSVTALAQGVYKFELKVTDNSGATDTDTMQVTVNAALNQLPTANAGLDQNITLPTNTVSLNGSGTDPDGTITAYLWTKISGPASGSITNATSATTSVTALAQGVYKFELKVTDNSGATDTDTMQVTVNAAPNQLPTANAGLDQNITLPTNTVSLNGSGTDPDGTITAYLWTKISGPASGSITNATSATTNATALVVGVYKFELKVTDNSGAIDTDTMQVTVNAALNQLPTANAGLDQNITLPSNSVSLNGSGTDPDGTITAYLWTKISGPVSGSITNVTSATTIAAALVVGVYKFELKVTDNSGATDTDTMQVTVNAALNQLPTANAGLDQNITLPTNTVSLNGSGTDPDGTITAYLWTKISGPASGSITNATSATTNATALVVGVYKFELKVTDNSGAIDTDTMQVTVNDAPPPPNEAPTANAGADTSIYLPVNTISLSGTGNDPDGFITSYSWRIISGTTYLLTNANNSIADLSDLQQGIYEAELTVTDNSGATGKDTITITVGAGRLQAGKDDVRIIGNPIQNSLVAEITSASVNRQIKIVLFDIRGAVLVEKDLRISQNVQLEKIDMTGYGSGTYILQVYFDNKTPIVRKAIKL